MPHKPYRAFTKAVWLLCIVAAMVCPIPLLAQYIITTAGSGVIGNEGDGYPALEAAMDSITSIAFTGGNLFINDQYINSVRQVNSAGIISKFAGKGTPGYSGDSGPATEAQLRQNFSVAADNAGNLYIADLDNNVIRKVSPAGIITTIAGTGTAGFSGDGGPATAAQFDHPIGIAVDHSGNVFVGDALNRRIRKIFPSGIITTVAGNGALGSGGDGGLATIANLGTYTYGLATDDAGNLYICDGDNNRIRKVTPSGIITTVAGNGTFGFGGDGGPATSAALKKPTGVYVSHSGEIYIADCWNNRVRKVNAAGIITTIAGTGTPGFSGDNGLATSANVNYPISVCADADENIFIADSRNHRIRKIIKPLSFVNGRNQDIEVCESSTVSVNDALAILDFSTGTTDNWTLLAGPAHGYATVTYSAISTGGVITPSGLSYTPMAGFTGVDSFKVRVANSVDNDITTIHVKVNPLLASAGTVSGPGNVCVGSIITLSASIAGGTWSATNANVSIASAGPDCKVTGELSGVSDVQYTLTNGCGSLSTTSTVTIDPLPATGSLAGADKVCLGSTITMTASVAGGIWNSSYGKATVTAGAVTGVAPGNDIIRYTVFNSWCEATVTKVITVETFPGAKIIWGADNMCVGETITMTDSAANGIWNTASPLATTVTIMPPAPARCIVPALAAGSATITYSVTNSCGTATATHDIAIHPLPDAPSITEHLGLLSVPDLYQAYQWTKNGVIIQGATYDTFFAMAPALYAVSVANEYGCKSTSDPLSYSGCNPDDILLYPNPTTETVRVLWCQPVNVRILSIDGRVISVQKGTNEVSLEGLPTAIYMLDIFNNNNKPIKTIRITKLSGH